MKNSDILFYLNKLTDSDIYRICEISRDDVVYLITKNKLEFKLRKKLFESLKKCFYERKSLNRKLNISKLNINNKKTRKKSIEKHRENIERLRLSFDDISLKNKDVKTESNKGKLECYNRSNKSNRNEYNICEVKLILDNNTREKLRLLFSFIDFLTDILRSIPNGYEYESIKLIVLTKFNEFYVFSQIIDKDFIVERINQLIRYWVRENRIPERFSFNGGCTIKKDATIIFLNPLGKFFVDNPTLLRFRMEYKWIKFYPKFDLIKRNKDYYVQIPYQSKSKTEQHTSCSDSDFGTGVTLPTVLDKIEAYINFLEKVDRAYYKPNMEKLENQKLSGWAVSGGLPSLGKNR